MEIAFVVWPQSKNPAFIWTIDHRQLTWLKVG